jgi:hypothetical protein
MLDGYMVEVASCYMHLKEAEENARLIAAAPDLLEALESAYRCLSWHEANHGVAMDRVVVERARLAIAAARGG